MTVWARVNRIGWVHLWRTKKDYDEGEPSAHFFNGAVDPLWKEQRFPAETVRALQAGGLVEIEDPGYLDEDSGTGSDEA